MTNEEPPKPNLKTLNETLENTLLCPGNDPAILSKQAELLDQLFSAIVERRVMEKLEHTYYEGQAAQQWLKLALQCQKQCTDAVKSRAAIDYMENLNRINTAPHPVKIVKRTEGS